MNYAAKSTRVEGHLHLGSDAIFDGLDTTEDDIIAALSQNNLDFCLVYPANNNGSIEVEREKHAQVRKLCEKYPDKFVGICQVNPNYGKKTYIEEVSAYVNEGFRGVAVNPQIYGWDPMSSKGDLVMQTAQTLKLPVFAYVGIGLPLGLPIRIAPLCRKYSDVKVVLVHTGKSIFGDQCDTVGQMCENVYFETSLGLRMRGIKNYVRKFGAHRVMMGSAILSEVAHTLYSYEKSGLTEEEKSWCMGKTALSIMGMDGGNLR